jgi:hypothetical protein
MNLDYRISFINDQARLNTLCEGLVSVPALALDIETINWWSPQAERVALIQLAYRSGEGLRVFFERGAWWAEVAYRLRPEDAPPEALAAWEGHADRLGPFKRPRNAMVEAERHAVQLRNRHGDGLRLGEGAP